MSADDRVAFLKGGAKASRKWKVDDLANIESWQQQANAIGFTHETAITQTPAEPAEDRIDKAAMVARRLLAERLKKQSVITGPEIRLEAARGLISAGFNTAADVSAVTRRLAHDGVLQDGQKTHLIWVEGADGQVKITTGLHQDQEEEVIALVREAAADISRSLSIDELDTTGLTFKGEHGEAQKDAMEQLATGGAFSLVIGSAGSGKSTLLRPIVAAHRARGRKVYGVSQAWKQADALLEAGIDRLHTRATSVFLDGAEDGRTPLDQDTVVVLDEISQIGTKDFLRLVRLQKRFGFQIISAGDGKQCQALTAGSIIDLLRQALGSEAVPEIHTTIRQQTERERDITNLFREATPEAAGKAIEMKLEDATAELVDGGYDEAVERVAELAVAEGATVSAPTNADALAIGRAIRKRRGITGGVARRATNGQGDEYDLELAQGDKVRLFSRTTARFATNNSHIGNNGTVLDVVAVRDDGLELRTKAGKTGFVAWGKLMDAGRVKLAYGDCLTVDSAQGMTGEVHICAAPAGTSSMSAEKGYVALSRHKKRCWLITSKGAELLGATEARPLGVPEPLTDRDLWAHVSRNLSRRTIKENATSILAQVTEADIGISRAFQAAARKKGPTSVKRRLAFARLARAVKAGAMRMRGLVSELRVG
jgi:ATP-dependent exoDNAse (exonuclease V) alpha subunit